MPEYTVRVEGDETICCDSCDFPAPLSEFRGDPGRPNRLLCEFCSTTMASRYTEYPSADLFIQLRAETWRAAACVFNAQKFGFAAGTDGKTPDQLRQDLRSGRWDWSEVAEKPGSAAGVALPDGGKR